MARRCVHATAGGLAITVTFTQCEQQKQSSTCAGGAGTESPCEGPSTLAIDDTGISRPSWSSAQTLGKARSTVTQAKNSHATARDALRKETEHIRTCSIAPDHGRPSLYRNREKSGAGTMPTNILTSLPPRPEDLEYRIIAKHLVLRDVDANIIVDLRRHHEGREQSGDRNNGTCTDGSTEACTCCTGPWTISPGQTLLACHERRATGRPQWRGSKNLDALMKANGELATGQQPRVAH